MEKKRKTELDVDMDLATEEVPTEVIDEKIEAAPIEGEAKAKGSRFKFPTLSPKILILIAVLLLVVALITGAVIYFFFLEESPPEVKEPLDKKEALVKKEAPTFVKIPQYQFSPFFHPLKSKKGDIFLKIAFSVDLSNEAVATEIDQNIALLRANMAFLLKKKTLSDLESDPDKIKLSREITGVLNRSLQNGTVKKVYYTQFFLK